MRAVFSSVWLYLIGLLTSGLDILYIWTELRHDIGNLRFIHQKVSPGPLIKAGQQLWIYKYGFKFADHRDQILQLPSP
jgi:hypothetical protein